MHYMSAQGCQDTSARLGLSSLGDTIRRLTIGKGNHWLYDANASGDGSWEKMRFETCYIFGSMAGWHILAYLEGTSFTSSWWGGACDFQGAG
eukprot:c3693_g1_i1 orf=84-359(-)